MDESYGRAQRHQYGKRGLTDIPIPMVNAAQAYIDAKIPHWVYYCCAPQGPWLNRFLDTPLPKIRMSGWLFYRLTQRLPALGFQLLARQYVWSGWVDGVCVCVCVCSGGEERERERER